MNTVLRAAGECQERNGLNEAFRRESGIKRAPLGRDKRVGYMLDRRLLTIDRAQGPQV